MQRVKFYVDRMCAERIVACMLQSPVRMRTEVYYGCLSSLAAVWHALSKRRSGTVVKISRKSVMKWSGQSSLLLPAIIGHR